MRHVEICTVHTLTIIKKKEKEKEKKTQGLRKDKRGSYLAWLWLLCFWERETTSKVWDLNRNFFLDLH